MAAKHQYRTSDYMDWDTMLSLVRKLYRDGDYRMSLLIGYGSFFGLRISDLRTLTWAMLLDDDHFTLNEQKTGKRRDFTVPLVIQQYIENYCLRNGIGHSDLIFPITTREVQKILARVCDYLGYEGISTHSFRKWYATEIYKNNGFDIALVQRLLQHSSADVLKKAVIYCKWNFGHIVVMILFDGKSSIFSYNALSA